MSLCLSVSLSLSLQLSFGYEFQFEFGFELKVDFDWIVPTLVPNLVTVPGCAHPACAIWGEPSMESKKHPLPDNSFAYLRYTTVVFHLPCVFFHFDFQFLFLLSFLSLSPCCIIVLFLSFWLLSANCSLSLSLCIELELICNSHDLHFVQFVFWLLTWAVIEVRRSGWGRGVVAYANEDLCWLCVC